MGFEVPSAVLPAIPTQGGAKSTNLPLGKFSDLRLRAFTSEPPPINRKFIDHCETAFGAPVVKQHVDSTIFSTQNKKKCVFDEYLTKGTSFNRCATNTTITKDRLLKFCRGGVDDEKMVHFAALLTNSALNRFTRDGELRKLEPNLDPENIRTKKTAKGAVGDSLASTDGYFGGSKPHGKKEDNSVTARTWILDCIKYLNAYYDQHWRGGDGPSVEEGASVIKDIMGQKFFNAHPFCFVVTFLKAEHMLASDLDKKPPREIWAAAFLIAFIDSILFEQAHREAFCNPFTSDYHGINHSGGGSAAFVESMINSLGSDQFREKVEKLVEKFVNDPSCKTKDIFDNLPESMKFVAEERDVSRFDVHQFSYYFLTFYSAFLFDAMHSMDSLQRKDFILLFFTIISSYYSMIQIVASAGDQFSKGYFVYVWRVLASGMYNTAHVGSFFHSNHIRMVDIVSNFTGNEMCKFLASPSGVKYAPHREVLEMSFVESKKGGYAHFSDDFLSINRFPSIYFKALVNTPFIYSKAMMCLKPPSNYDVAEMRSMHFFFDFFDYYFPDINEFARDLADFSPQLEATWGMCRGTSAGMEHSEGMTKSTLLHDPKTRLHNYFFFFFSIMDEDTGNFLICGAMFLKLFIVLLGPNEYTVFRKEENILPKLFKPVSKLTKNLYELALYVSIIAFYANKNEPLYMKLFKLHNLLLDSAGVGINSNFLRERRHDPHNNPVFMALISREASGIGVNLDHVVTFPSYADIERHWNTPHGVVMDNDISVRENSRFTATKKTYSASCPKEIQAVSALLKDTTLDEISLFGQRAITLLEELLSSKNVVVGE
jgi:hypothetical protein